MGLGTYPDVSLAQARSQAAECRELIRNLTDPIDHRRKQRQQAMPARQHLFRDCAEQYITTHAAAWKSVKHARQWTASLQQYAYPYIGSLDMAEIETRHILSILEPIWTTKNETATRVRQRIEKILNWAGVKKYRTGDNPARWVGHLDHLLPAPSKVKPVRHHPAMHWKDIPAFMAQLLPRQNISSRGLLLTIMTAKRTNEIIAAMPDEFEMDTLIWNIPGERMKSGRPHREPLSIEAGCIVRDLLTGQVMGNTHLFPGRGQKHMSNIAMLKYLKEDLGYPSLTVHGFRSTFRDWVAEATDFPRELAEAALSHVLSDKTEAAYQRGDLLERRRALMQGWVDYLLHEA